MVMIIKMEMDFKEVTKGRPIKVNPCSVAGWRQTRKASIADTAAHFGISRRTVTNYCRDHGEEAREARRMFPILKNIAECDRVIAAGEQYLEMFKARYGKLP